MSKLLDGKIALVTGAGAGIGRAVSELFAAEGARLIATDRDAASLAGLAGEKRELDVADAAAVAALAAATGRIDILVNCAGFVESGTLLDTEAAQWQKSFAVNVFAMADVIKAFLPAMLEAGGGSIINIASVAGFKGVPNRCIYGTSKAAVIGLTKSVAIDFIAKGIRCNAICPGTIQTPSLDDRVAAQASAAGGLDQARAAFVARQPLGRLGTAEEIAALAVYLASDESAFTTGTIHVIDGGWSL